MKISRRQHITIFIAIIVTFAFSLSITKVPTVKSLDDPHLWYGFVDYQNNTNVSNTLVTLTDTDAGNNTINVTTNTYGFYVADLSEISGSSDGDYVVINCSSNGQVGENASTIDIGELYQWCNLSGGTRLENESLSINITPASWDAGTTSWGSSYNTTDTYFNLTNEGNVKINVKIQGENFTWNGNQWNLTNTTALNNYSLGYKKSAAGSWTNITIANSSFITDLKHNSSYFSYTYWQLFGFNFSMPTSSSPEPSGEQQFNVTFWSIEA